MVTIKYTKGAIVFVIAHGTFIIYANVLFLYVPTICRYGYLQCFFFGDERRVNRSLDLPR